MTWLICMLLACTVEQPSPADAGPGEAAPVLAASLAPAAPQPLPEPTEEAYAASHILVAWRGAVSAPASVTRSREEARALAASLRARALGGEDFASLARSYSDGPSAPRGGKLGVYRTGTMVPDFERAVAAAEVGQLGPLVETPFGWHVVRREPVVQIEASHVLVTWEDAWRSGVSRSKADARARAEQVLELLNSGTPFEEVARSWSDDSTRQTGGALGRIAPGQMIPAFEEAAFALEVGQTSEIVETPYGFHVIRRTR